MDSRTKNSVRNVLFSEAAYLVVLLLQFANRSIFIRLLPDAYLGLNGLFSNVLAILSLAELGVGAAINYALYKPLKENDIETVRSLMALYRRLYHMTGVIVLAAGALLAPFLGHLIRDLPSDLPEIYQYFVLYLLNAGITYFFAYKRALIICDQKEYIVTIASTLSRVMLLILQMTVLICFKNYTLYLSVMILMSVLENLVVSAAADKLYPFLKNTVSKNRKVGKLDPLIGRGIRKNMYALIFQRIGEVIVYATDDLIIAKYVSFASVGLYSNYSMLIQAVQTAVYRFFDAVTASVGNLAVTREKDHVERVLYRILFLDAWMFIFCSVCMLCLLQPFIRIWIGADYLLPRGTMLIIVANFYLEGMRATMVTFKRAVGLFWQSRYKAVAEGLLNLALSIPLAVRFGVAGTLLGTIISTTCVSAIVEPYMLFRHFFHKGFQRYLWQQVRYMVIAIGTAFLTGVSCSFVCVYFACADSAPGFGLRLLLCVLVPNLCMGIVFWKDENFVYFRERIRQWICGKWSDGESSIRF